MFLLWLRRILRVSLKFGQVDPILTRSTSKGKVELETLLSPCFGISPVGNIEEDQGRLLKQMLKIETFFLRSSFWKIEGIIHPGLGFQIFEIWRRVFFFTSNLLLRALLRNIRKSNKMFWENMKGKLLDSFLKKILF